MSVYHAATQTAGAAMTFTVKTATDPLAMIPAIRQQLVEMLKGQVIGFTGSQHRIMAFRMQANQSEHPILDVLGPDIVRAE